MSQSGWDIWISTKGVWNKKACETLYFTMILKKQKTTRINYKAYKNSVRVNRRYFLGRTRTKESGDLYKRMNIIHKKKKRYHIIIFFS